jgi:hypothetical protein
MGNLIPVKGHSGLYRDSNTMAIINTNNTSTTDSNIRSAKSKMKQRDDDIKTLQSDVSEIKHILKQLLELR